VYEAKGVSDGVSEVLKDLKADTTIEVARISTDQILKNKMNSFDVVIFSGGSGGAQGKSLGADGREKVRTFIQDGGGYVGICAGAYLASADYDWSLHILDAKVLDRSHWARGFGDVELKLSASGRDSLSLPSDRTTVYYHQGPILAPAENSELDAASCPGKPRLLPDDSAMGVCWRSVRILNVQRAWIRLFRQLYAGRLREVLRHRI
jgi:putative intracellular protease/amidase